MTMTVTIRLTEVFLETPREEEDARYWEIVRDNLRRYRNEAVNDYQTARGYGPLQYQKGVF